MKIYIITIAYNNLNGLMRTYKSIKSQSLSGFSWIVIDGLSKDGTGEWLSDLTKLDHGFNIEFLSEKDDGIYDAMNKGIKLIGSEDSAYTIFMNSGDEFYSSDVLKDFSNECSTHELPPLAIYGNANYIHPDGSEFLVSSRFPKRIPFGMPSSHQAMFFRCDFLKSTKYDTTFKLGGDYNLLCSCYVSGIASVVRFNSPICNFYLDGVSVNKRKDALFENLRTRIDTLCMNRVSAYGLFVLHYIHMLMKRHIPIVAKFIRKVF